MTDISPSRTIAVCVSVTALATGVSGLSAAHAGAPEVAWTNPTGGMFQHGANWAGGAPPGSAQMAVFALPVTNAVTLGASALCAGVVARSGAQVVLDLAGFSYILGGGSSVVVGEGSGAGALLTVRGGEVSGLNVEIGKSEGGVGTLVVQGEETALEAALDLFVARDEGTVGALAVVEGAEAAARTVYIGFDEESLGAGLITGSGSSLTCDQDLVMAQFGDASLDVTAGGYVSARNVAAGRSSASSGTLRIVGAESELFTLFKLSMGSGLGAAGRLEISDGGGARSLFGVLAEIQNSSGDADVAGKGSWWDVDDALYVGYRGHGTLRIADGARVDSKFSVIGRYANAAGEVRVEGQSALWVNEQQIEVGAAGAGPCSLVVEAGATVRSGSVVVRAAGTLGGAGLLEAAVEIAGVHRPGPWSAATGVSVVVGAYTLDPTGTLELDIAGLTPGVEHDVLVVVGEAEIAGALRLVWDESFDPALGASMTIISAAGVDGWFSAVEAPELVWPKRLIVERVGETVALRVGLRRLSEFGSLFPEADGPSWGERGGAARDAGSVLRAFREWASAASKGDLCDGGFQPEPQIGPVERISGR